MLRHTARVRALFERVRRPLTMFAIGAGLALPASAFMMREDGVRAASRAAAEGADLATMSSSAGMLGARELAAARTTLRLSRAYNVPVGMAVQIHRAAEAVGIAPRVAFGLVRTESAFRRTAVSPVGAVGLTQVMPGTARWMKPGTTRSDLFDPQTNLELGFTYLKGLLDRYDGDVRLALTAYNRGPGVVDKLVKRGRNPENGYARRVLADPTQVRLTPAQAQLAARTFSSPGIPAPVARSSAHRHKAAHSAHRTSRRHRLTSHHVLHSRRHHARPRRRHR